MSIRPYPKPRADVNDYPTVIALIITYRRLPLALATIRSVKEHVVWPNIGFHIADDGSGPEYVNALRDEIGPTYSVTVSDGAREGVGHNMNLGIEGCLSRADLWLHLEDDWVLPEPLDLEPCVRLLVEEDKVGMVRLGRLTPGIQGETISGADKVWWYMRRKSNGYVFSGNPALRHRRFHQAYGTYKTGLMPGQTELSYCSQFDHGEGPGIVSPAWLSYTAVYQHIGDSQSFKWHMETGGRTAEEAAAIFEGMDV